ncbi:Acyltransferase family protein [Stieleria maiorica]|uniref:Acyltransferase family protein n=1 Tax=Stieleria maiorica TaxID=2795974 RepID=A0A5B9MLF3_9BACT|nr:acyltransferase [Stieleria maiorica]QEF99767.1 Acyltransferase family protein [Stieleria maiorica]
MVRLMRLLSACFLILSVAAGVCATRAAPVSEAPLKQFAIRPTERLGTFLPKTTLNVERDGEIRTVRCECQVDNAWVNLEFRLLETKTGRSIPFDVNISYYHGTDGTERWETGNKVATRFIEISERGQYLVFVKGTTGKGDDPNSDTYHSGLSVDVTIYDGPQKFRAWLLILAGSSVLGTSMLLWTLTHRRSRSNNADEFPLNVPSEPSPPGRLIMLDGLRGAAALGVVCCHFFVPEMSSIATKLNSIFPDPIPTLARHGDLGVEVFFVLSGFVIAYSIGNRRMSGRYIANFALRRSIRLDPPYLAAIALSVLLWAAYLPGGLGECYQQSHGWKGIVANSLYLQNILGFPSIIGVAWTLCLEIQFYLAYIGLFSLAQFVSRHLRIKRLPDHCDVDVSQVALLIAFLPLTLASIYCWNNSLSDFSFFGSWHRFFVGVMCYWAFAQRINSVAFVAYAFVLATLAIYSSDLRGGTATTTAILIYTAGRTGHLSSALSASWLQYLGRISYSLYLVHILIGVSLVNMLWSPTQSTTMTLCMFLIGLAASIAGAELMYRLFERPSVRLSRKLKWRTADQSASPVTFQVGSSAVPTTTELPIGQ